MTQSLLHILSAKSVTVISISKKLGVKRQAVYQTLNCQTNSSRRIRLHIASIIGRPPSLLFHALPEKVKILDDFEFMNSQQSSKK
jgi:hypothetical protein